MSSGVKVTCETAKVRKNRAKCENWVGTMVALLLVVQAIIVRFGLSLNFKCKRKSLITKEGGSDS